MLDEILELNTAAMDSIYCAMFDGVKHGYRGKWREQDFVEHIEHAIIHLLSLKNPREGDDEDHLSHALCRLAMAATMEYDESEESGDDVDRWESEGGAAVGRSEIVGNPLRTHQTGTVGGYKFEHGQVVQHASGLDVRPPWDRYVGNGEWHCARCNRNHPYIENCSY